MQPLKRDKKKVKNVKTKKKRVLLHSMGHTRIHRRKKKKAHISSVMHPPVCRDKLDKTKNKKSNSHGEAREKKKRKTKKKKKEHRAARNRKAGELRPFLEKLSRFPAEK